MIDHHVDRPDVYGRQRPQLTGPNRPIGSISNLTHHAWKSSPDRHCTQRQPQHHGSPDSHRIQRRGHHTTTATRTSIHPDTPHHRVDWTTWWLWRGACTRSHPELGRENPQRPWYCVLRHGRVGRRQVFQSTSNTPHHHYNITNAGWSSPVARQAHNLKVIGSNPIPATKPSSTPRTAGSWGIARVGLLAPHVIPMTTHRATAKTPINLSRLTVADPHSALPSLRPQQGARMQIRKSRYH